MLGVCGKRILWPGADEDGVAQLWRAVGRAAGGGQAGKRCFSLRKTKNAPPIVSNVGLWQPIKWVVSASFPFTPTPKRVQKKRKQTHVRPTRCVCRVCLSRAASKSSSSALAWAPGRFERHSIGPLNGCVQELAIDNHKTEPFFGTGNLSSQAISMATVTRAWVRNRRPTWVATSISR